MIMMMIVFSPEENELRMMMVIMLAFRLEKDDGVMLTMILAQDDLAECFKFGGE